MYCILCCCAYVLKMLFSFASSDGMSRSGVFITCMTEIERVRVEGGVDIFRTVKAARAQRPHMVYTSVSDAWHEIVCNPTYIACTNTCVHVFCRVRCVWQLPSGLLFDPRVYSDAMRSTPARDLFH